MNQNCEIVRDLLPLYLDEVCSNSSRSLVEGHLAECAECASELAALRQGEMEAGLNIEKTGVISRQAKQFRRKSTLAGLVVAGILMIPILVCLIVDLASGQGLSWFFIVLSALLLVASVSALPLLMTEHRFLWSVAGFTGSLVLLLGVCCLYTVGDWFFVAASSCLFGLCVCLSPAVVNCQPIRGLLGNQRALAVFIADTALFFLMMVCIGAKVRSAGYNRLAFGISAPLIAYVWVLFLLIRYPKISGLARAGLCVMVSAACAYFIPGLIGFLIRSPIALPVDGVTVISTLVIAGLGAILFVVGLFVRRKEKNQ